MKKSTKFQSQIKVFELLHFSFNLHPEKDNEKILGIEDDEDILIKLFIFVMTEWDKIDLFTGFKSVKDEII